MDSNQRVPKYSPNIQSYDHDLEKDEEELEEILIRMEREEEPTATSNVCYIVLKLN